jgi:hypothetical protein
MPPVCFAHTDIARRIAENYGGKAGAVGHAATAWEDCQWSL